MTNWKTDQLSSLFTIISRLEGENEVSSFMRDVATINELTEMAKRWEAAQLIDKGTSYREISESTGLSTTTVSRVAYWLKNGEGGYRKAINQLKTNENQ